MKREEFLARLEQGLAGLGEEERAEALKFYNEYLDEVGPGQEEAEIARLGDPHRVANIIRANLGPAPRRRPRQPKCPVPPGRNPSFRWRGLPGRRRLHSPSWNWRHKVRKGKKQPPP